MSSFLSLLLFNTNNCSYFFYFFVLEMNYRMSAGGMTTHFTSLFLDCALSVKTAIETDKPMLWNSNETNSESQRERWEENERRESPSQNNRHNSMACQTYRRRVRNMGGGIRERLILSSSTTAEFDIHGAYML